jgi:hypothetical protein
MFTTTSYALSAELARDPARTVLFLMALGTICWAEPAFGTFRMNPSRSTFTGETQPKSLTVRIEPHAKGEVFTMDRIEADGRITTSSTILYFDSAPRTFDDFGCSGTQSSRRVDSQAVEILRKCGSGAWIRLVRRLAAQPQQMVFDIIEQNSDGRRFERRWVLEKQTLSVIEQRK